MTTSPNIYDEEGKERESEGARQCSSGQVREAAKKRPREGGRRWEAAKERGMEGERRVGKEWKGWQGMERDLE